MKEGTFLGIVEYIIPGLHWEIHETGGLKKGHGGRKGIKGMK